MATTNTDRGVMEARTAPTPDTTTAGRSTAELTGDLVRQMTALVHDEIALAKAEMTEKGKRAGLGAGMFGAAGVLAFLGIGCLTVCVIAAIALVAPVWVGALVVGAGYLAVAGVVTAAGRNELGHATPPVPTEAVESTKEDVEWIKTRATSTTR